MIIREIIDDPEMVLAQFDWFNDYKDTRLYCQVEAPELLPRLDAGYKRWGNRAKSSRIFTEPHPEQPGVILYGCPRWSTYAGMWLIDFYDQWANGTGATIARGEDLAWIKANTDEVKAMQARCKEWVDKTEDIPF